MSAITADVVHHLIRAGDLLPVCGTVPGRDEITGDWHSGHDRDLLIEAVGFGLPGCTTSLSREALGGWTPLILDEDFDDE